MKEALEHGKNNPEFFLNLGKVYMNHLFNQKGAYFTLQKGLMVCPTDPRIKAMLRKVGVRQKPPLRFLSRRHFLNRYLGKKFRKNIKKGHPSPLTRAAPL